MTLRQFVAICAALMATPAGAATFSYTGNLTQDDDVVLFEFELTAESLVTLQSYSYGGGTMADGTVVAAGGFDPVLALYDGSGTRIALQDDADFGAGVLDVSLQTTLAAGSYTVALSQYDNFGLLNLSDGFSEQGNGTFTSEYGCDNGMFCDYGGNDRTSFFAFELDGVTSVAVTSPDAVVPLPASLPLMLAGMGALAVLRRRADHGGSPRPR